LSVPGGASIVTNAALLTALATFACAAYAIKSKRDFSRMRGFLMAATLVLIVASLLAIFLKIPGLQVAISAVTAVIFLGWLLHDVGEVVSGAETNYISAALGIYLDVLNIFVSLLNILGVIPGGDD
jgi:modulator of FtsH protease